MAVLYDRLDRLEEILFSLCRIAEHMEEQLPPDSIAGRHVHEILVSLRRESDNLRNLAHQGDIELARDAE